MWTNNFEDVMLTDDCGATGSVEVTFTATDECNHQSTTKATFTIVDSTAPTIDEEASDLTVECDGNGNTDQLDAWVNNNGGVRTTAPLLDTLNFDLFRLLHLMFVDQ